MDTERAEGIVLRKQPVTESSLIVTWFTREHGKLKTLAKGARRPKGPFQGKIDLFTGTRLYFYQASGATCTCCMIVSWKIPTRNCAIRWRH